jgi:hypothetical protein
MLQRTIQHAPFVLLQHTPALTGMPTTTQQLQHPSIFSLSATSLCQLHVSVYMVLFRYPHLLCLIASDYVFC